MARKYKRSSNGQFAGGGGTKVSSGGGRKPNVTASQKRVIPAKGSVAQKKANPSGQRLQGAKKAAKQVGKFAAKNPRLVIGVAGLAASKAVGKKLGGIEKLAEAVQTGRRLAQSQVADKRGIGGKPGANLRASKRNVRGAYKIRSS